MPAREGCCFAGTERTMPDGQDKDGVRAPMLRGDGRADLGLTAMSADPRFDRWLSRRLHEAYDGVLKEALPAELERLVLQLAAQEDAAPRGSVDRPEKPEIGLQCDDHSTSGPTVRDAWLLRS